MRQADFARSTVAALLVSLLSTDAGAAQPNYDPPQPSPDFGTPEATTPAGSAADLMITMTMGVFNRQSEASGVTASHTNLMAEVVKLHDKRREQENQRGGMKS